MNPELYDSFIASIRESDHRYLLGVDGLSRSGKTTYSKNLARYLTEQNYHVVTIHLDDYVEPWSIRYGTGLPEWEEYYSLQWNVMELREHLFEPMRSGDTLEIPRYHPELNVYEQHAVAIGDADVIIVEGVFLQREEWLGFFDKVVYLDVSRSVRFLREKPETRRKIKKFTERYWKAEEYYMEKCQPIKNADVVITYLEGEG
ncbi:hypothetical protein LCM20_06345 [Halobacillus litoralis]|uniref:hypothetical protein n=1 Tax=Halobacillus litoralis TaxID=45668 RepID=UPI001CD6B56F|nr:hypothetical protein [Halobacillus litoralis]MCA0970200.1 hypothetical protein [Halobacillus litoralis]